MNIGAHVSIAGGFDKCLDRISAMGGNCLMTFASSPRSLQVKPIAPSIIEAYNTKKASLGLGAHFFHCVYLVNLAADKADYVDASIDTLIFYQQLAGEIGAAGTIFHIGSHTGRGFDAVKDQIVRAVNYVTDSSPKGVKLYLENTAGQSGAVGSFEELAEIIDRVGDKSKIGVCLDTQHTHASGIHLSEALTKFDRLIGKKYLQVIHLNDSKSAFGSHLDRHENLGVGTIGQEELKAFLHAPEVASVPLILEVPGDGEGPRKQDIDTAKSLMG